MDLEKTDGEVLKWLKTRSSVTLSVMLMMNI